MSAEPTPPVWGRDTKRIAFVATLTVAAVLAYYARSLLVVLIFAGLFAYLLQPIIGRLERAGMSRGLATGLSLLVVIILLVLVPILVVPVVARQVLVFLTGLYEATLLALGTFQRFVAENPSIRLFNMDFDLAGATEQIQNSLQETVQQFQLPNMIDAIGYLQEGLSLSFRVLGTAVSVAAGVVWGVVVAFVTMLFLLMYTFYLTRDAPRLRAWVDRLLPQQFAGEIDQLLDRINYVWQSFFRGQIVLSLIIGAIVTAALTIVGMPAALVLGILAGLLEVIPNLGPALAAIPAVILAFVQGSTWMPVSNAAFALIVLAIYIVIQQLENAIIVPRVMGQNLNLHPILVLIGIVIGTAALGIVGAFLAAPVLATLAVVGAYAMAKMMDRAPFTDTFPPETSTVMSPRRWQRWLQTRLRRPKP